MISLQSANLYANLFLLAPLKQWLRRLWWRYALKVTITLPWPNQIKKINGGKQVVHSSDPNDHYRPWLEQNIGRQHWDWDWQWAQASYFPGRYGARVVHDAVIIKVLRRHRERAAEMKLLLG